MAKLVALPGYDIISGFKGVVDFYINYQTCPAETGEVGTPCARSWPRSPGHERAPAVEEQWAPFIKAVSYWPQLSPEVRAAFIKMASGTGLTGRDLFIRSYIKGLY